MKSINDEIRKVEKDLTEYFKLDKNCLNVKELRMKLKTLKEVRELIEYILKEIVGKLPETSESIRAYYRVKEILGSSE